MTKHSDILIIGGGISGLLTARELRLAGREVSVIDKAVLGRESSWAGGGILLPIYPWRYPQAVSDLVLASLKQYPLLQQELLQATGIDPEWRPCGMFICKTLDLTAANTWCEMHQMPQFAASEGQMTGINTLFQQPLWLPEVAQIRNPRLLQSLTAYLRQLGVVFIENAEITGLHTQNQRITQLDTVSQNFSVNELVVCTGAWSVNLLQALLPAELNQPVLPIAPVKGQMLLFDAEPNTLPFMILDNDHYLIPRRDGKILAGSTVEHVGFDKTTTELAKQSLYSLATALYPQLQDYPVIKHWAGLRPGTPEGIPFISRHPAFANLSINAGHFRNGLVMGPASARLLADLILERPSQVDPMPYSIKYR